MTQEEKELLLKDLCARLTYGVKVDVNFYDAAKELTCDLLRDLFLGEKRLRPYLRPMSSMPEEERDELKEICAGYLDEWENAETVVDRWKLDAKTSYLRSAFYNSHHLDWNGLIEKGLALEAPEGMYSV